MRGALNDALVQEFAAAAECEGQPMSILEAAPQYGEGLNHWLSVTVRATRSAQVRHWWAARGFVVSRLMRVRLGPLRLSRDLPRGHSRALTAGERQGLLNETDPAAAETAALRD
jgi:23S rRNA pseudouridine2605 synthase